MTTAPEQDEPEGSRPWYRRPRPLAVTATAAVLVVAAVTLGVLWATRGPDEVATEDVIERFDADGSGDDEVASGDLRPEPGVYVYDASGAEELSLLGTRQEWGPTMPATVTADGESCWRLRIEFSSAHWQEQRYCVDDGTLRETSGTSYQGFDLGATTVGETNEFTCDPPHAVLDLDAEPGDSWPQRCVGRSADRDTEVVTAGTTTFVGREELRIGDETVDALHYRQQRELSGDQSGTQDEHLWFSAQDGMLLRNETDTSAVSPSPIGEVEFTQRGEFELRSLTPQR